METINGYAAVSCSFLLALSLGCRSESDHPSEEAMVSDEQTSTDQAASEAKLRTLSLALSPSAQPSEPRAESTESESQVEQPVVLKQDGGRRPNILFVLTDDQSWRTAGCYAGRSWVETPNIDRLAGEGVRFTHAYGFPTCTVSRATLLTGLLPHAIQTLKMSDDKRGYDPDVCRFWPAELRKSGYHTAMIGKWHLGHDTGHGRDWDHSVIWIQRPGLKQPNQHRWYFDPELSVDGEPKREVSGYSTDLYTKATVEYIRRPHDKPWCLWLCYNAPHAPFLPHERHKEQYAGVDIQKPVTAKPACSYAMPSGETIRNYNRLISAIDEGMGQIYTTLKDTGQLDNTLIVFTSDQGFAWGEQGVVGKIAPYDACLRVPLIVRYPKLAAGGEVCDHPVSLTDLPPTMLALSRTEMPWPMHGRDLRPLLEDPKAPWEHPVLLENFYVQYGSDTDVGVTTGATLFGIPWWISLTREKYKYIRSLVPGDIEEFYDLESDPQELRNLALEPEFSEVLADYRKRTVEELRRTSAGLVDNMPQPEILHSAGTP